MFLDCAAYFSQCPDALLRFGTSEGTKCQRSHDVPLGDCYRVKGVCQTRLGKITRRARIDRAHSTTKHYYYEKTYQFTDRLFAGTGWSRVGATASRTAVTTKEQARPGKNARDSSTARRECSQASGEAGEASRSDEGTGRDESARSYESTRCGKEPKSSSAQGICDRPGNECFRSTDRRSDE